MSISDDLNPPAKAEIAIRALALKYSADLKSKMDDRVIEMEEDDDSHYLIYQVLGVSDTEGKLIDVYQNKGRFLYKYAGSFLEDAAKICVLEKFPQSGSLFIPNTLSPRPRPSRLIVLSKTLALWKSSGETLRRTAITLQKNILACRL